MLAETATQQHEDGWYVRQGGQVRGPLSSARVRHEVLQGRLRLEDQVSRDRLVWSALAESPEVVPLQLRRDSAIDAEARGVQIRSDRRRALGTITLVVVTVAVLVAWSLRKDPGRVLPAAPDCAAPAGPGVNWSHCRLDGLTLPSAPLQGADLSNASLINARLNDAQLGGADLGYANLAGGQLSYAVLKGARLLGANLRGVDLTHADLRDAELAHADLTGAQAGGARWTGARLAGAIWLDGRRCAAASIGVCR